MNFIAIFSSAEIFSSVFQETFLVSGFPNLPPRISRKTNGIILEITARFPGSFPAVFPHHQL
jgi:hypothetical protein